MKKISGILIMSLIILMGCGAQSTEKEIDTKKAEITYTVPEVPAKEAVYKEGKEYKLFLGDPEDSKDEIYVGEEIPAGEYEVIDVEEDRFCKPKLKDADEFNMFAGRTIYKRQMINIEEGEKLSAFNCGSNSGGINITLQGEKQLVEEAKEAVAAYDVTEKLEYDEYGTETCYIDENKSQCSELTKYNELNANKNQNDEIVSSVIEKLEINDEKETCYIDEETVSCNKLKTYDELKAEINQ